MRISLIAALSENHVIGRNKGMPWNMPADLKYFFKTTKNHHVLMGRKTYQEFGVSKPLPDRINLLVSRTPNLKLPGIIIFASIQEAIDFARDAGDEELFVIGGGGIYQQTIDLADRMYLTRIHTHIDDGHVFFPKFDLNDWKLVSEKPCKADSQNPFDYTFLIYDRKASDI